MTRTPTQLNEDPPAWFMPLRQTQELQPVVNAPAQAATQPTPADAAYQQLRQATSAGQALASPQGPPPGPQTREEFDAVLASNPDPWAAFTQLLDNQWQLKTPEQKGRVYESWIRRSAEEDAAVFDRKPRETIVSRRGEEAAQLFPDIPFQGQGYGRVVRLYRQAQDIVDEWNKTQTIGADEQILSIPQEDRPLFQSIVSDVAAKRLNKDAGWWAKARQRLSSGEQFVQESGERVLAKILPGQTANRTLEGLEWLHGVRQTILQSGNPAQGESWYGEAGLAAVEMAPAMLLSPAGKGGWAVRAPQIAYWTGLIAPGLEKELVEKGMSRGEATAFAYPAAVVEGLLEGLEPRQLAAMSGSGGKGVVRGMLQSAIGYAGEYSEEFYQGLTEVFMRKLASKQNENVKFDSAAEWKGFADQMKQTGLPLLALMGVPAAAGAGVRRIRTTGAEATASVQATRPMGQPSAAITEPPAAQEGVAVSEAGLPDAAAQTPPAAPSVAPPPASEAISGTESEKVETTDEELAERGLLPKPLGQRVADVRDGVVKRLVAGGWQQADAEDAAQNASVYALTHPEKYENAGDELEGWLANKAEQLAKNERRKRKRVVQPAEEGAEPVAPTEPAAPETYTAEQLEGIAELPKLREIWRQWYPDKKGLVSAKRMRADILAAQAAWQEVGVAPAAKAIGTRAEAEVPAPETQPAPAEQQSPFQQRVQEAVSTVPALRNSKVEVDEGARTASVTTPSGHAVTIHFDADEQLRVAEKHAKGEQRGKRGRGAYAYQKRGVGKQVLAPGIYLSSEATHETLNHEAVHWMEDVGVVTKEEVKQHGGREGIAKAYAQWVKEGRKESNGIFDRIWQFLGRILGVQRGKGTFAQIEDRTQQPALPSTTWADVPEGVDLRSTLKAAGVDPKSVEYSDDYKRWRVKGSAPEAAPVQDMTPVASQPVAKPKSIGKKKPADFEPAETLSPLLTVATGEVVERVKKSVQGAYDSLKKADFAAYGKGLGFTLSGTKTEMKKQLDNLVDKLGVSYNQTQVFADKPAAAEQPMPESVKSVLDKLPERVRTESPIARVRKGKSLGTDAEGLSDAAALYDKRTKTLYVLDESHPDFADEVRNEAIAAWAWEKLTPEQYARWRELKGMPKSADVKGGVGGGMANVDTFAQDAMAWMDGKETPSAPLMEELFGKRAAPQNDTKAKIKAGIAKAAQDKSAQALMPNTVFLSEVYKASGLTSPDSFHQALDEMRRSGELTLSVVDLVEALSPEQNAKRRASRYESMGTPFDHIRLDKPVATSAQVEAKRTEPVETPAQVPSAANADVLAAVRKVANASGRARIADVQAALPELSAKEVADALLQMERSEEAILEGLDDPREITQRDKEAAVPNSLGHPRQIVFLGPKASAPEAVAAHPAQTEPVAEPEGPLSQTIRRRQELLDGMNAGATTTADIDAHIEAVRALPKAKRDLFLEKHANISGKRNALQQYRNMLTAQLDMVVKAEGMPKSIGKTEPVGTSAQPQTKANEPKMALPKRQPKTDWKPDAIKAIAGTKIGSELTLPELYEKLKAKHKGLTEDEFKAGVKQLHDAGELKLDMYTRAPAEIAGQMTIAHDAANEPPYYYVRESTAEWRARRAAPTIGKKAEAVDTGGKIEATDNAARVERMASSFEEHARAYEGGKGLEAGAEGIDYRWKADGLRVFLEQVRAGKSLDAARQVAVAQMREWVRKHNARRPKDRAWQRWEGSGEDTIDTAVRMMSQKEDFGKPEAAKVDTSGKAEDIVIGARSLNGFDKSEIERLLRREQDKGKPAWFDGSFLYTLSGKYSVRRDDKGNLKVENLHNLSKEGLLRWFDASEYVSYNRAAKEMSDEMKAAEKAKDEARKAKEEAALAESREYSRKSDEARQKLQEGVKAAKGKSQEVEIAVVDGTKKVKATVYGDLAVHKGGIKDKTWRVTHIPSGLALPGEYNTKSSAVEAAWLLNQGLDWSKKKPPVDTVDEARKRLAWHTPTRGDAEIPAFLTDEPPVEQPKKSIGKPRKPAATKGEGARKSALKALSPGDIQALNAMAAERSTAPWSMSDPATPAGKTLLNRLRNDKRKKVGLKSIFQMIGDAFGTLTVVGKSQLSRTTPAQYEPRPHVVRSKSGQSMFDWHEQGHALSRLLTDADPDWMTDHNADLLTLTAMQNNQASAETPEEGMAEFCRRYVTNYQSLPTSMRQAMEQKIGSLSPTLLQTLKDANRAYSYHRSRPISDQMRADREDKGKHKPLLTGMRSAMVNVLTQVFGGEAAVHFNVMLPIARAVAKHSRAAYDELMRQSKGGKADLYNAWANTLLAPAEAIRVLVGDKGGQQGIRIFAWGDEMISADDADRMREAGLPVPDLDVPHGEWYYITDESFQDIRDKLGDSWEEFEAWGQARASMERLTRGLTEEDGRPHLPPWLYEGKTIEEVQAFIDDTASAHPEWEDSFKAVQRYFDGLLVMSVINGEFSADEAITIKQAWEDYWPLQRQVEGTDAKGGGSGEMDISAGVYRAFGSPLPFRSLIEAAEYRTKRAVQSFYQNRLRKSVLAISQLVNELDAPADAKIRASRLMIPLHMDMKVAAKVSPAEQQAWFAEELARVINEQRQEDLGRELDEDEVVAPDDIDVNLPWRTIYRAKKPGAIQVVGVYEQGKAQYYQVVDPLLFDTLARTKDTRSWVKWVDKVGVKSINPWKRAMTQNILFAMRNIVRDALTAFAMGGGLKSLIPGRYALRGLTGKVSGRLEADPPPRMVLYSRSLEDLQTPRHKQLWDRFWRSGLDAATEGLHVPGWADMTVLERVGELPAIMSSAAIWPVTMFNWGTGGRLLSQQSEDLTRGGAWLVARDQGATAETASRADAEISGNFAQRQPNAGFRTFVKMAGFLNPSLQIIWGYARRATSADYHERHLMWAKAPVAAMWGAVGAAINVALIRSLFGMLKGDDDDDETVAEKMLNNMREQPDYERRTTMSVMGIARLPFEPGVFGAMFSFGWNMMQDWLLEPEADTGKRLGEMARNMASLPGPYDMLQPYLKTAMEVNMGPGGFSFYRNEEIVPAYLRTYHPLEPEKQVNENTPEFYRWLHKRIGGHPLKWEYAMRSLFTRQLTDSIAFLDGLDKTGKVQVQNLPILRGLITSTAYGNRSSSVHKLRSVAQQLETVASQLKDIKDPKARAVLKSQLQELHESHVAFSAMDEMWKQAKKEDKKSGGDKAALKAVEQQMTSFGRQYADWKAGVRKSPPDGYEDAKKKWIGTKVHAVTDDQYEGDGSELTAYGYTVEQAAQAYMEYYAKRFNGVYERDSRGTPTGNYKEAYLKRTARLQHIMSGKPAVWAPKKKKGFTPAAQNDPE